MASNRANLQTIISADASQFSATMRRAGGTAAATGKRIGKGMAVGGAAVGAAGVAALAFAGVMAGRMMVNGVKNALDLGGALSDVAAQTGLSAGQAAVLQRAFTDNGISADKLGGVINKMQKSIVDMGNGAKGPTEAFDSLGISFNEIQSLSPSDQFALIAKKVSGISDPALRAATAMKIFGKSGGELNTLFADGGAIGNAGKTLGTQTEILDRRAGDFDKASDMLTGAGVKMQGFFVGMADTLVDPLLMLLESFDAMDLAAMGQAAGESILKAVQFAEDLIDNVVNFGIALKQTFDVASAAIAMLFDPNLWSGFADLGKFAMMTIFNEGYKLVLSIGAALSAALPPAADLFLELMTILTKPDFWKGLGNVLAGLAVGFGAIMLKVIAGFLKQLSKIPGVGKFLKGATDEIDTKAAEATSKSRDMMAEGKDLLGPMVDSVIASAGKVGKAASDAFTETFGSTEDVFDTSGLVKSGVDKITGATTGVMEEVNKEVGGSGFARDFLKGLVIETGGGSPSKAAGEAITKEAITKSAGLTSAGFAGLGGLAKMQEDRAAGIGPGTTGAFAGDRARLGIKSGLQTGSLGAKRKVGGDKENKKSEDLQEKQAGSLESIDLKITQALTVG